jgi:phosphoketolase
LKTPKGFGAPDFINERKIVGNCEAHQVVFDDLENKKQIKMLEE